jgi:hypothetical protein
MFCTLGNTRQTKALAFSGDRYSHARHEHPFTTKTCAQNRSATFSGGLVADTC